MTKLKTLKDLKKMRIVGHPDICKTSGDLIESEEIKQEAIKWVKEMVDGVKRDWVMHFFNITEEDLK